MVDPETDDDRDARKHPRLQGAALACDGQYEAQTMSTCLILALIEVSGC